MSVLKENIEDELTKLKCFLDLFPTANYDLLKFLPRFQVKVGFQKKEKWTATNHSAVFDLEVFYIYTDVEDMKEQEAANNIMSELLENYSDFFGTEEFLPTDISNSFCVEVTESCEEGNKIEQTHEPPEDRMLLMGNSEHLMMTKNVTESDNIVLSTSAHSSPVNQVTVHAEEDFTEENSRNAGVGKIAFSESLQHADSLEDNDQEISLHNCTLEVLRTRLHQCVENVVESFSLPKVPLLDVPEESLDNEPITHEENNNKEERVQCTSVPEIGMDNSSKLTLNLTSGTYDLNANKESDVPKGREVSTRDNRVRPEIVRLDLKCVTNTSTWEDPVPVFKSWQDEYEHELGEAQLSPQAGRLTNHPLEEDPQPMLCRRYLNFGHRQRFLDESDSITASLKGLSSFRYDLYCSFIYYSHCAFIMSFLLFGYSSLVPCIFRCRKHNRLILVLELYIFLYRTICHRN